MAVRCEIHPPHPAPSASHHIRGKRKGCSCPARTVRERPSHEILEGCHLMLASSWASMPFVLQISERKAESKAMKIAENNDSYEVRHARRTNGGLSSGLHAKFESHSSYVVAFL